MKKSLLILILSSLLLSSCDIPFLSGLFNKTAKEEKKTQQNEPKEGEEGGEEDPAVVPPEVDPPVEDDGVSVSFPKKVIDIEISNNPTYLTVNFSKELEIDDKEGHFTSSNTSVATVDDYGRLRGISEGSALITFSMVKFDASCTMTVYVHESLSNIVREYIRLDNPDDIKVGDELVFASPNLGVGASVNVQAGYIVPAPVSFSSDKSKITAMSQYVAEYYVGPGKDDDVFTFENQENNYLACKDTTGGRKLIYSDNGKAQINWIVEKPSGYNETYIVSYDLVDDYWLMFNKVSHDDSDIRFNIYDSSEQASVMEKPIIYRKTIIRN